MNTNKLIGQEFLHFAKLNSTNDFALKLIAKSDPIEGTVISTQEQTRGRGQFGRSWDSERDKNLILSVILFPGFLDVHRVFDLNIAMSVAIRDQLAGLIKQKVYIKWPNDLLVEDEKIAGILIQNGISGQKIRYSVIGIGININQTVFNSYCPPATSLALLNGRKYARTELQDTLFSFLDERYFQLRTGKFPEIKENYNRNLYLYQQKARFRKTDGAVIEGLILGVGNDGSLMLKDLSGIHSFRNNEISYIL